MRRLIVAMLVCAWLVGCANQMENYAATNRPLAEQGKLKWSAYYQGLYDEAIKSNSADRGAIALRSAHMIQSAKALEQGLITQDQFDDLRRISQAAQASEDDAKRARAAMAFAGAMQNISQQAQQNAAAAQQRAAAANPTPVRTTCRTYLNQTDCTSQ